MDPSQRTASRHRLSLPGWVLVLGVVLLLVAAPTLFVVAATAEADWALLAGLACALVGMVAVGQVFMPERASFRAGTKIWQNAGLPGGGGVAGCDTGHLAGLGDGGSREPAPGGHAGPPEMSLAAVDAARAGDSATAAGSSGRLRRPATAAGRC